MTRTSPTFIHDFRSNFFTPIQDINTSNSRRKYVNFYQLTKIRSIPTMTTTNQIPIFILSTVLLLSSCVSNVKTPQPYTKNGIKITVEETESSSRYTHSILGIAENVSGRDFRMCAISFSLIDQEGVKIGDANAVSQGLRNGQKWRFEAAALLLNRDPFWKFNGPPFKSIEIGNVTCM